MRSRVAKRPRFTGQNLRMPHAPKWKIAVNCSHDFMREIHAGRTKDGACYPRRLWLNLISACQTNRGDLKIEPKQTSRFVFDMSCGKSKRREETGEGIVTRKFHCFAS